MSRFETSELPFFEPPLTDDPSPTSPPSTVSPSAPCAGYWANREAPPRPPEPPADLVTIEAYARHRGEVGLSGHSAAAVRSAIRDGRILSYGGWVSISEADADWATNSKQIARHDSRARPPGCMTRKEYAADRKARGLAVGEKSSLEYYIHKGKVTLMDGGWIDPRRADEELRDVVPDHRPLLRGRGDLETAAGYLGAKARAELAKAELKELELGRKQGLFIDRKTEERHAYAVGRSIQRALVDVLPAKVAMEVAPMTDPKAIEAFMRRAIEHELHAIEGLRRPILGG